MEMHEKFIKKSIDLNIIGTANITKVCSELGVKLIYFSTSYVYPGTKGNYKENNPLLPKNNYSWSKLGGESAVQMYHNSLILRVCMTEKPFVHKKAFGDFITNFIFHEDIAKNLLKLINKKGVINVVGKIQSVFSFVKKYNPKIKKISAKKILGNKYPLNPSMNINKLKKIIK
jgi:dTDP-4-dehydrorhamnose reductase